MTEADQMGWAGDYTPALLRTATITGAICTTICLVLLAGYLLGGNY